MLQERSSASNALQAGLQRRVCCTDENVCSVLLTPAPASRRGSAEERRRRRLADDEAALPWADLEERCPLPWSLNQSWRHFNGADHRPGLAFGDGWSFNGVCRTDQCFFWRVCLIQWVDRNHGYDMHAFEHVALRLLPVLLGASFWAPLLEPERVCTLPDCVPKIIFHRVLVYRRRRSMVMERPVPGSRFVVVPRLLRIDRRTLH